MLVKSFICSTVSRKGFSTTKEFIHEPDSRAQCLALEENVKEFGLTFFGMRDRRQGECICGRIFVCLHQFISMGRYRPHHWSGTGIYLARSYLCLWGFSYLK